MYSDIEKWTRGKGIHDIKEMIRDLPPYQYANVKGPGDTDERYKSMPLPLFNKLFHELVLELDKFPSQEHFAKRWIKKAEESKYIEAYKKLGITKGKFKKELKCRVKRNLPSFIREVYTYKKITLMEDEHGVIAVYNLGWDLAGYDFIIAQGDSVLFGIKSYVDTPKSRGYLKEKEEDRYSISIPYKYLPLSLKDKVNINGYYLYTDQQVEESVSKWILNTPHVCWAKIDEPRRKGYGNHRGTLERIG